MMEWELGRGVWHLLGIASCGGSGWAPQLLDSFIAMKFDSLSFHRNASEFECDCYASVPFPPESRQGNCRQADLSTCSLIEALCDSTDLINHL